MNEWHHVDYSCDLTKFFKSNRNLFKSNRTVFQIKFLYIKSNFQKWFNSRF